MLKKARTVAIDKNEVDFWVLEYRCKDGAVFSALGNHSREVTWKIQCGLDSTPFEIKLLVDKSMMSAASVSVDCNGQRVFPPTGGKSKESLREDFRWSTPFRGTLKEIGIQGLFEGCPSSWGPQYWYPATITGQRNDGSFEVELKLPDGRGGWRESHIPALDAKDLRLMATKARIEVPHRTLHLEVPRQDPLQATLEVDNGELITHFFARPTPPPGKGRSKVHFKVNKMRTEVEADIGHRDLEGLLKMEAYIITQEATKQKRKWVVQIGPFAEHTIEVEHKWRSKIATLTVDGDVFIEAAPEDLDCSGDSWECKFRFKGEKVFTFDVFESNRDGMPLDSKGVVEKRMPYAIECEVKLPSNNDMMHSHLAIGGRAFEHLETKPTNYGETEMKVSPEALMFTHNLPVPYKVNVEAKSGVEAVLTNAYQNVAQRAQSGGGFFSMLSCCASPQVDPGVNSEIN